jgi:hypothetical protein
MPVGLGVAAGVVLVGAAVTWPGRSRADEPIELALVVHVATRDGRPVVSAQEVRRTVGVASEAFAPAAVAFAVGEVRALPDGHAELADIRARHRLRRHLVPGAINVFVVDAILDPVPSEATRRAAARVGREPSGRLSGAHIPAPGRRPGTFVLVDHHGGALTVAHELGHLLGLPHHRDETNIMSYGRDRTGFDDRQLRVIRLFAGRLRRFARL